MAKRKPLSSNVDAAKAAAIAGAITETESPEYDGETETVSYNLPVELIELVRDLAEERLKVDRKEKRLARRRGEKPPQARRSASAVIREAVEAYRPSIESEMAALREQGKE